MSTRSKRGEAPPRQRSVGEAELREEPHQHPQGDLGLEAGERRAEAEVRTTAERVVVCVLAADIEPMRIGLASSTRLSASFSTSAAHSLGGGLLSPRP